VDQRNIQVTYGLQDELISKIVLIESTRDEPEPVEPIYVSLVYNVRIPNTRDVSILAQKGEGKWETLVANDVSFDGLKEHKFAMARLLRFTTVMVMSRFKCDYMEIEPSKKPFQIKSSVDNRIFFNVPKGLIKKTEDFMMSVQPIDTAVLNELKETGEAYNKKLLTCSPMLRAEWPMATFSKPVTVNLPCPPSPAYVKKMASLKKQKDEKMKAPQKPVAPTTDEPAKPKAEKKAKDAKGGVGESEIEVAVPEKATKWYMGQYGQTEDDDNDKLCLLATAHGNKYLYCSNVVITCPKPDAVAFDIDTAYDKMVVIRVRHETSEEELKLIVADLCQQLTFRSVRIIVRHKESDPYDVCLQVGMYSVQDRMERVLKEEGYVTDPMDKYNGHANIKEGDSLIIQLRGNLVSPGWDSDQRHLIFNSNLPCKLSFKVREYDRYLQKSFEQYRGAVRVTRQYYLPPEKKAMRPGVPPPQPILKAVMLTDISVEIPKTHIEADPMPYRVPVVLEDCKYVNADLLVHLAGELGEEWLKLATQLHIDHVRLQSIMRQESHAMAESMNEDKMKLDMLMTWLKRCPQAADKVRILAEAFENISRNDLVSYLGQGYQKTLKKEHHVSQKKSKISKASTAPSPGSPPGMTSAESEVVEETTTTTTTL
jgi:hypothetical protein